MAANHTTDAEIVEALRAVAKHGSARKAATAMGVHHTVVLSRQAMAEARGLTADSPIMDEASKLKLELTAARRDIRLLQRENDTAERIRTEIYGLAARTPEPPPWISTFEDKVGFSNEVPCAIWSDWHYGERVRPEEVGGMNDFDAEVAQERITRLVDTTIDLCFNHAGRSKKRYPGIVIMLGGDMLTGDIHEDLTATNDRTTQQCINDLTDIIAAALAKLADSFGKVFVPCVVGNHGRSTRKPRMKGRVYTSHEWNIYCSLERHFRKDKRVQFHIPNESDAHFSIYGHRFLLTHGDSLGVKGGDGIIGAIGPIMRGSIKTARGEAAIGRDYDTIVMGHWHQMLWLPGCIVNGALKGYDEYARLAIRAPYSPASQGLWFVHPKHGITVRREVILQDPPAAQTGRPWLTWAA